MKRSFSFPLFNTFDSPDAALSCGRRQTTTVAPQSLALMNNALIQRRARAFAARLIRESGDNPEQWVERAWLLALGRQPSPEERARNLSFLQIADPAEEEGWAPREASNVPAGRASRLSKLCLAIFNMNEFLYVD